ncbi:MAG: alpha/beta fold hydrolase [Ktedonobacterales bacterium]
MATQFVTARDGTRIAYDTTGSGPLLLLLHGFGRDRRMWHDAGHVAALSAAYTVAPVDLRGHGESDRPTEASAYAAEQLIDDLHAVADALGADQFRYWGYSYGATLGVQVAAHSPRVTRAVLAGSYFGSQRDEQWLRQGIAQTEMVIGAIEHKQLDALGLSDQERATITTFSPYVARACLLGIASFPDVRPADARCPVLVYSGTQDHALPAIEAQRTALEAARIPVEVFDGLTHPQLVTARETVLPVVRAFLEGAEGAQDA